MSANLHYKFDQEKVEFYLNKIMKPYFSKKGYGITDFTIIGQNLIFSLKREKDDAPSIEDLLKGLIRHVKGIEKRQSKKDYVPKEKKVMPYGFEKEFKILSQHNDPEHSSQLYVSLTLPILTQELYEKIEEVSNELDSIGQRLTKN